MTCTTAAAQIEVVGGADTHQDTHTAAVVDTAGRRLGHCTFATTDPSRPGGWRRADGGREDRG